MPVTNHCYVPRVIDAAFMQALEAAGGNVASSMGIIRRSSAPAPTGERVARDLKRRTGEESPAIKLLREWKAGHPGREWAIREDTDGRGIIITLMQARRQCCIRVPWPSPTLSYESASRATAEAASKLIDSIREPCEGATFVQAAEPDPPAPPEPQETKP